MLEIIDDNGFLPEGAEALLTAVACAALETEGIRECAACLTIVDGDTIHRLNRETRGVDSETDVLSFPSIKYAYPLTAIGSPAKLKSAYEPEYGMPFLGDIVLNVNRARLQAEEYGHSLAREMGYLTAHAMFHLMGYDHMTDADKAKMRPMEDKTMDKIGLYR